MSFFGVFMVVTYAAISGAILLGVFSVALIVAARLFDLNERRKNADRAAN